MPSSIVKMAPHFGHLIFVSFAISAYLHHHSPSIKKRRRKKPISPENPFGLRRKRDEGG